MDPITIGMIGAGVAGQAASYMDIGGNRMRKKQIEQQKKLTDIQTDANKDLANYGMGISKEMWDYTNYENQRKHMEQAGLNPALMYGHAGAGGSTSSASAGSAGGSQASDEASLKQAQMAQQGMALQMAKLGSEIELNRATAREREAEAGKKSGVDTDLANKQIDNLTADINNKSVQRIGMILQNDFDEIRNEVREATAGSEIRSMDFLAKQIAKNIQKINREIESLDIDINIKDQTKNSIIESARLQNEQIMADILVKESQGKLNETQAQTIVQQIGINLSQLGTNIDKNAIERETNQILRDNNITSAGTNAISSLTNIIIGTLMFRGLGGKAKTVKGFGR